MSKYYIGIDLGGTNIATGVVDENYKIIAKAGCKTNLPREAEAIVSDMAKTVFEAIDNAFITIDDIEWIGIGSPGIANSEKGIIEYSNNLGFKNTPLVKLLQRHINKPIFIENDANAAAYGEFIAGAAKGSKNAVAITLGTGVGGGIIINEKIYSGFNFAGAEIGHMVIEHNGNMCTCGRKGCFEAYSSATALIKMTQEAMEKDKDSMMWKLYENEGTVSGRLAFEAMNNGDKSAWNVVNKYVEYLSCGIINIINIFQPEVLCVGGGVSNQGDILLDPVRKIVDREVYTRDSKSKTKIVKALLGNDAGIIGAAFLGKNKN